MGERKDSWRKMMGLSRFDIFRMYLDEIIWGYFGVVFWIAVVINLVAISFGFIWKALTGPIRFLRKL